jgi:uncharacterized repeat protein (TIGR01451 family)
MTWAADPHSIVTMSPRSAPTVFEGLHDQAGTARRRRRVKGVLATTLVAATSFVVPAITSSASAQLTGSSYDGANGVLDTGLPAAVNPVDMTDVTGSGDLSNWGGGSKEDDICPTVATGTASPKDDLDHFYAGTEQTASGTFLYLAWHRQNTSGTTTIDFELNQSGLVPTGCTNSVSRARTAGDVLITYDFQGSGPFTITTEMRSWVGTSLAGAWGAPVALPNSATAAESSINASGSFGEMVVNLNLIVPGALTTCETFAGARPNTRSSSSSFNNSIKDWVTPVTKTISTCGSVVIDKRDDAGAPLPNAAFTLYTDVAGAKGVAVVPVKTCTTDATGACTIPNVLPGTYWVVETVTPPGHDTAADMQVVVALGGNTPANPLAFVDDRKPATINIVKVDGARTPLAGAVFTLFTDNAGVIGTTTGKTCITAAITGTCSISGILPPGTYWVRETTTPPGHTTAADQQVTLALDETKTLTFVDVRKTIDIDLTKTVNGQHPLASAPLVVQGGSTLTYSLHIVNSGQIDLVLTDLDDSLRTPLPASCAALLGTTLAAGASTTCSYTATANADAHNVATVEGTDLFNRTATATDDTFVSVIHPKIALAKGGPAAGHVGDKVTYVFTVTNPGDASLTIVGIDDPRCTAPPTLVSKTGGVDNVLDPGEAWTYECTYTIVASDGTSVLNTAKVSAVDQLGAVASATASHTTKVLHPTISIVKTASPQSVAGSGTVTYTYVVTNTGDTVLTDVAVVDDRLGGIAFVTSLQPGESKTFTRAVDVTTASPTTNVGTATGVDPLGLKVSASSQATISVVLGEVLVAPAPELPRTGAPLATEMKVAFALLLIGMTLVLVVERRRATAEATD